MAKKITNVIDNVIKPVYSTINGRAQVLDMGVHSKVLSNLLYA